MSEKFSVHQQPDQLSTRVIAAVAVASVLLVISLSFVSAWVLERRQLFHLDAPTRALSAPEAPSSINLVNQTLLEHDQASEWPSRRTQERRLGRYGWVDREAGVAHIPIERAMDLVVQRRAAGRAEAQEGRDP